MSPYFSELHALGWRIVDFGDAVALHCGFRVGSEASAFSQTACIGGVERGFRRRAHAALRTRKGASGRGLTSPYFSNYTPWGEWKVDSGDARTLHCGHGKVPPGEV